MINTGLLAAILGLPPRQRDVFGWLLTPADRSALWSCLDLELHLNEAAQLDARRPPFPEACP
jgi:hypothetical protein